MSNYSLRKTANVLRCHWWFPQKMTSAKQAQKFHTDDVHHPHLGRASDWLEMCFTQSALPRSG